MFVPNSEATLTDILKELSSHGYRTELSTGAGGRVLRRETGESYPAEGFTIEEFRRLEGTSDPDDEMIVLGVRGPVSVPPGVLVLGFGPHASPEDAAVLAKLKDLHH